MTLDEFNRKYGVTSLDLERPSQEDADDTAEARHSAADRFLEVFGFDHMVDLWIHEIAKEVPERDREKVFRVFREILPAEKFKTKVADLAANYYTRRELLAMVTFWSSPEGQSMVKRGHLMSGPAVPSGGRLDALEDRRVAAQRYIAVVDVRQPYAYITIAVASHLVGSSRETFLGQADREYPTFVRTLPEKIAAYYTRREIDALRRFAESPVGQSTMNRLPAYAAGVATFIREVMEEAKAKGMF